MLRRITVDELTWAALAEPRQSEIEAIARQIIADHHVAAAETECGLVVTVTEQHIRLQVKRLSDDATIVSTDVHSSALGKHIREYVDVVRNIARVDEGLGSSRVEVLDMAKKVAHDDAGRALMRACPEFGLDLPTGRKLFTLLLALRVDTTTLDGVFAHRPIR